jgi:hypothetical protein
MVEQGESVRKVQNGRGERTRSVMSSEPEGENGAASSELVWYTRQAPKLFWSMLRIDLNVFVAGLPVYACHSFRMKMSKLS